MVRRALLSVALIACSPPPKTKTFTADDAPERFDDLAVLVTNHLHKLDPNSAVELGFHDFDGKLPDLSPAGLKGLLAAKVSNKVIAAMRARAR